MYRSVKPKESHCACSGHHVVGSKEEQPAGTAVSIEQESGEEGDVSKNVQQADDITNFLHYMVLQDNRRTEREKEDRERRERQEERDRQDREDRLQRARECGC